MRARPGVPRGFSLVELMAVLALAGILTAIAAAGVSAMAIRQGSRDQLREVPDALRRARNHALKLVCSVDVTATSSPASITATPQIGCPITTPLTIQLGAKVTLAALAPLTFTPRGATTSTSNVTLTATSSDGESLTAVVWPGIGTIRVQ